MGWWHEGDESFKDLESDREVVSLINVFVVCQFLNHQETEHRIF
jgi:hypothetical protein